MNTPCARSVPHTAAASQTPAYVGRFAPSPTGPLHAGSLVTALASWLDARAHGGRWLLRIEDVDTQRCDAALIPVIVQQLAALGLLADAAPQVQTAHMAAYAQALDALVHSGLAYPCACSRADVLAQHEAVHGPRAREHAAIYPGTCRHGLAGKAPRAWRLLTTDASGGDCTVNWPDRRLGAQSQNVTQAVGDFVLKRADGCWAYQLAVVVDDARQGITDVVRGEDLADNTARQILLQRALGLPTPRYWHGPLVRGADGAKLSKQNGATALALGTPAQGLLALRAAAAVLGLPDRPSAQTPAQWLEAAVAPWAARWCMNR